LMRCAHWEFAIVPGRHDPPFCDLALAPAGLGEEADFCP
jgi:hypothetical protein